MATLRSEYDSIMNCVYTSLEEKTEILKNRRMGFPQSRLDNLWALTTSLALEMCQEIFSIRYIAANQHQLITKYLNKAGKIISKIEAL